MHTWLKLSPLKAERVSVLTLVEGQVIRLHYAGRADHAGSGAVNELLLAISRCPR